MSNKHRCNRTAFTLIELLAALAVLSMLVMMLFMAFSNANRMMILGSNQMDKNQAVRAVLQQIARDLERTAYSGGNTNMYFDSTSTTPNTICGVSVPNCTLYCLSALTTSEGCTNGSVVNVGYTVTQIPETNYDVMVPKYALQRGSDAGPSLPITNWPAYVNVSSGLLPANFWQTLSDNIVGLNFIFYTNADNYVTTWATTSLPTSVGITIWAIDSANYNLARKINSSTIFQTNLHSYTNRVFLPQSTQN